MSGDADRAQELLQDVFVRTWRKLDTYRGQAAFSTWLHRLAVNVVLLARRSEARRNAREQLTDDVTVFERGTAPPAGPVLQIDLEKAIGGLPNAARSVFVLHDIEGYRHDEIAEHMGIAVGTSKAHLHRARRLLREALE
jgi:RNA polymerase sigma-70 factor (ECF subfamily)